MSGRTMFRRIESLFTSNYDVKTFLKKALEDDVYVTKYKNKAGFRVYKTEVSPSGKTEVLCLDPEDNVYSEIKRYTSDRDDSCLQRTITYVKKLSAKPKTTVMNLFGINMKNTHINWGDLENIHAVIADSKEIQNTIMSNRIKVSQFDTNQIKADLRKELITDSSRISELPFFDLKHNQIDKLYSVTRQSGIKI